MSKTIVIDGYLIHDMVSLYAEINRVFMQQEDSSLGQSLDAFNDVLYGGYGPIKGNEPITLVWKNFENNRKIFGIDMTLDFYRNKLKYPDLFDVKSIQEMIENLEKGSGQTYFEIILEMIETEHPNIELLKH